MATKVNTETGEIEGAEIPFAADGDSLAVMTPEQVRAYIEREMPSLAQPEVAKGARKYEDVAGALPFLHKDRLIEQPFAIMHVERVYGAATQSDVGQDLVFVMAQAIAELDDDGNPTKFGLLFGYNAGDDVSVHGRECLALMDIASPTTPVICAYGLTERTAQKGTYYTLRPTADRYEGSLFPA